MSTADRARNWSARVQAARDRFEQSGSVADLDEAVAAAREAARALPRRHEGRAECLYELVSALHLRLGLLGMRPDLDEAISAAREAVALDPVNAGYLSALGILLHARFDDSGQARDIDEAVALGRTAISLPPSHIQDGPASLTNLAVVLRARYDLLGSFADLTESIDLERTALALSQPRSETRKGILCNLGNALRQSYERTGVPKELDEAAALARRAVRAEPTGSTVQAKCLTSLGNTLHLRYERAGRQADFDEAVACAREALARVAADSPDRPRLLANLMNRLILPFERGDTDEAGADIVEAVALGREAVERTPVQHPVRPSLLNHLVMALALQAQQSRSTTYLNQAVATSRAAVEEARGLTERSVEAAYLTSLALALRFRYEWAGDLADLDEAVSAGRDALTGLPAPSTEWLRQHTVLTTVLFLRYEQAGSVADLDEAIDLRRMLLEDTPGNPALSPTIRPGMLSVLGMLLWTRFERTRDMVDLEEAIALGRDAVATTIGEDGVEVFLSNLGSTLLSRFDETEVLSDLDEAIEVSRRAVECTRRRGPDLARFESNLVYALLKRFQQTAEIKDLDEAITIGRDSITLVHDQHHERTKFLVNLGMALRARFEHPGAGGGREEDLNDAIAAFVEATEIELAPAVRRLVAARAAADLIAPSDPGRAGELLETAVVLLSEVSPRRLAREDQQHALGSSPRMLAGDAAALVLNDQRIPEGDRALRALSLLEAGRTVMIGQALDSRDDLSELRGCHPELAARFVELREQLDRDPEPVRPLPTMADGDISLSHRRVGRDRQELAAEFAAVLARIRELDGFASFGRPPAIGDLLSAAEEGPLVILNTSRYGSNALVLTPTGVTNVPLPRLEWESLIVKAAAFLSTLRSSVEGDSRIRREAQSDMRSVLEWLWDVVTQPALDALGHRGRPQRDDAWPRVWWVPCGPLSILPIHAAGYHTEAAKVRAPRTVMDRVVSSYTPSIRALHHTRRHAASRASTAAPRALGVAMPVTPGPAGPSRLHHVREEVRTLARHFPDLVSLDGGDGLQDSRSASSGGAALPVKATVLAQLARCPIAHFACHGHSDPTDPSLSRLLLLDHESDPLTVASLAPVALDGAQLAYLSACGTAVASTGMFIDESIHLASAFQLAGFPHVISTLWEIDDRLSVTVTDAFYAGLHTSGDSLDVGLSAYALHRAVRAVRDGRDLPGFVDRTRSPFLWAAYIHVGA